MTASNVRSLPSRLLGPLLAVGIAAAAPLARADLISSWEIPVGFPNGTGFIPVGTNYSPPNETTVGTNTGTFPIGGPAYPTGTPTYGVLAGSTSAVLNAFHSSASTTWTSPGGNGSLYAFSSNFWSPNDYYQIVLPTLGYTSIQVAWDQTRSSSGPSTFSLRMSTDGTNFSEVQPYTVNAVTWVSGTYNPLSTTTVALPSSADNLASLWIRFQNVTGTASSTGGTNRIDNIQVTGVPEPTTLLATGLVVAGAGALVARKRRVFGRGRVG